MQLLLAQDHLTTNRIIQLIEEVVLQEVVVTSLLIIEVLLPEAHLLAHTEEVHLLQAQEVVATEVVEVVTGVAEVVTGVAVLLQEVVEVAIEAVVHLLVAVAPVALAGLAIQEDNNQLG